MHVEGARLRLPAASQRSRVFRTPSPVANGETANTIDDPPRVEHSRPLPPSSRSHQER